MEYTVYKLLFPQTVHFGRHTLESSEMTFQADRLFSALCMEAIKQDENTFSQLLTAVQEGRILFSDAFPYADDELFLPKPLLRINQSRQDDDVSKRKLFKKLAYLPLCSLADYLAGNLQLETMPRQDFGRFATKVSVRLESDEEAEPYRIGTFAFHDHCGLYIILGYAAKEEKRFVENLLDSLSFSGIGGRRSAGMGRFELLPGKMPAAGMERITGEYKTYMTLSVSLPRDDELETAMEGARYLLEKRSGFVASTAYADEFHRKQDIYAFQAGSCFSYRFKGQVKNVANGGRHPVYRCLMPLFMGIEK